MRHNKRFDLRLTESDADRVRELSYVKKVPVSVLLRQLIRNEYKKHQLGENIG